jgi:tRNA(adenine34) deaminase
MKIALNEAWKAYEMGEIPVGALIIDCEGRILGKSHNETITRSDPTAHAEILALRQAAETVKNYRLIETKMYVTIEPCIMCAGAIIHARVEEIIFGVADPKWGGLESLYQLGKDERINHRLIVTSGVLGSDCEEIIQRFFKEKRRKQKDSFQLSDLIILNT